MNIRKQIGIKLPQIIINKINIYCEKVGLTRTAYIENLIRKDLSEKKLLTIKYKTINTWGENIEDMPVNPEEQEILI